ncbi:zinc-binding metallopeptidase family protein [Xylophilus ampelinus]|uniref:Zinc-ribbon domain-containing protein n=1 Tax=Xylophilus ampelinus TaxID=54067 RepID=A0A318SIR3_9BURK|nr:putative zinc-binding metallopeptidase [Xylophilus ampelinus]MCS4509804.1 putative zinc-binding peptidase [Xylophilus ampelinus]PYE78666.1 hypothetical protein DFQ15_10524 [Xylophilus ampelinus]
MTSCLITAVGPTTSRAYRCVCGKPLFLRNSLCLNCGRSLGYDPAMRTVVAIEPGVQPGDWVISGTGSDRIVHRCANLEAPSACNWLIPGGTTAHRHTPHNLDPGFCLSCSTTRTIPDLAKEENRELWRKLEIAKRRLLSQLLALALPIETRKERPNGLMFDMVEQVPGGPKVLTGHDEGLITLNIDEADDARREKIRAEMRESYRTLLGHFRHEIGHYYWDRLVRDTVWHQPYRTLFGDESVDYGESLKRHYENGPPADWPLHYVTSYATTHSWEDWAETWAHYLHMADTVDTAVSFGIDANNVDIESDPYTLDDLWRPDHPNAAAFLAFLNSWIVLTHALNELTRSMGQPDYYPFILPREAIAKLQFIHEVVRSYSVPAAALGVEETAADFDDSKAEPEARAA